MTERGTAVITGPTGAVGTALTEELLEAGWKVYAVTHPASRRTDSIPSGAHLLSLDLSEMGALPEKVGHADAFFHLGWRGTIGPGRNDMRMQEANIRASLDAVEAARDMGCEVFVGAGSQAEHGRIEGRMCADSPCAPLNGYGIAKLCAGQMTRIHCRAFGIRHVWARILSVYGPHDNPKSVIPMLMEALRRGEDMPLTAGEQEWDYLFSHDAARALIALAGSGKDGHIYPVGSGQVRTLRSCFELVRDLMAPGRALRLGELEYPAGQVMHLEADISGIRKDTGWKPQVPFEEGIRRTVEALRRE